MVVLSLVENIKDAATRLLPTPYTEVVEEATKPHFDVPQYENVLFLCNRANEEDPVDVVRAIRRRINDNDPKVKYLTVLTLDALVKNCGLKLHCEVASQKGLLRDLQNVAMLSPCITVNDYKAKESALALILNLSIWFSGHHDERVYILSTIADDVRHEMGPNAFEGINPDTNTLINSSLRRRGRSHYRNQSNSGTPAAESTRHQQRQHNSEAPIVDAVGIKYPTEDELAAMFDVCMTFAEYLNNAMVRDDGTIERDDVVRGFEAKIREDQRLVSMMLSSDLALENRDILQDVFKCQNSLLLRLKGDIQSLLNGATPPQASLTGVATAEHNCAQVKTPKSHDDAVQVAEASLLRPAPEVRTTPPVSQVEPLPEKPLLMEDKTPGVQTSVNTEKLILASELVAPTCDQQLTTPEEDTESPKMQAQTEEFVNPQSAPVVLLEDEANANGSEQQQSEADATKDDFDAFLDGRMV